MNRQLYKKMLYLLLKINSLIFCSLSAQPIEFKIQGEAALLMNADTQAVLFEVEAHQLYYPASTTKIATALYALKQQANNLDVSIEAEQESLVSISQKAKNQANYTHPAYWLEPDGMHIGIKKGEILTLRDLLKGMLIPSGNDAANVIAQALGPTIPTFMDNLNIYLKEIGCKQTTFNNPHGLHDPRHQTTAYDLAIMLKEGLKNPLFCEIIAQKSFMRPKTNKQAATTLLAGNRLIRPGKFYYAKALGGKTGYHAKAKQTYVAAAQHKGRTLIIVLLGYQNRNMMFEEAIKLFETAFNQPKVQRVFLKKGGQKFDLEMPKADQILHTYSDEDLSLDFYPAEDPKAKCLLYWDTLSLPIAKNQQVAQIKLISTKGETLKQIPLFAKEEVQLAWAYQLQETLSSWKWIIIALGAGLALFVFIRRIR